MRKAVMAALCVGLIFGFAPVAQAHVGADIEIYELATADLPDLFDGDITDWEDVLGDNFMDLDDFETLDDGGHGGAPKDPADMDYRLYTAWNATTQRLYFGMDRSDNIHLNQVDLNEYPVHGWQWDGFEVNIDGDHSGGVYNLGGAGEGMQHVTAQQWVVVTPSTTGAVGCTCQEGQLWAMGPEYSDGGGAVTGADPAISVHEAFLTPWDVLSPDGPAASTRSTLVQGGIIGISITINDFDDEPAAYHATHTHVFNGSSYWDADLMGDGLLIPCTGGDCGGAATAVGDNTWGRIKASFAD